jgi:hypothetical protein
MVSGLMLSRWAWSRVSLTVAFCVAVALSIAISLRITVAVALRVLAWRALWPGLALRSC